VLFFAWRPVCSGIGFVPIDNRANGNAESFAGSYLAARTRSVSCFQPRSVLFKCGTGSLMGSTDSTRELRKQNVAFQADDHLRHAGVQAYAEPHASESGNTARTL